MDLIKYGFLLALVVFSVFHLKDSWTDDSKKRARTKGFLLPMIVGYYLSAVFINHETKFSWVLVLALVTSWIGDVLLIPKGNGWFTAGGIAFLVSHISFIFVYATNISFAGVDWAIVAPVALVYIAIVTYILKLLKPTTPKIMFVPMFLYLLTNGTMNVFALMQLVSNPCAGSAVAYAGAVLFFISDCTLYLVRFYEKDVIFKKHFTVMLTYILGEALITYGVVLLNAFTIS